ncbi:hypothetical protein GIB67_003902 [Kingdonia uniflora]|uniref:Uncharacterized protein n=1 Tax=Kingdonia uniflora TaxID=39325 RepID=A0A7J7LJV4_9MAGN|nr:hypothetical protein GIB67_003902 [Kingdonia uniflora]
MECKDKESKKKKTKDKESEQNETANMESGEKDPHQNETAIRVNEKKEDEQNETANRENGEKDGQKNKTANKENGEKEGEQNVIANCAVARGTQLATIEAENQGSVTSSEGQKVEKIENVKFQQENKTNSNEDVTSNIHDSLPKVSGDGETIQNNSSANVTDNEDIEPSNISDSNSVVTELMDSHDQNAALMTETSNEGEQNLEIVLSEKTMNSSTSTKAKNETTKGEYTDSSTNPEIVKPAEENIISETTTAENKEVSSSSNGDDVQTDQSKNSMKIAEKEDSSISPNTSESIIEAQSNESDSTLQQELKEAHTDLGTLPEVETQGKNSGNVAAE